jgi:two-component system, response regulator PdtaR
VKILVVEDEALIAMDIQEKLIALGHDVPVTVDNGEDAIKMAGELKPDLVLMDIVIKGDMDGIETAEQIKKLYNIPSLFLTAYDNQSVLERVNKIKPLGYLIKPFDDTKLQDVVLELYINPGIRK